MSIEPIVVDVSCMARAAPAAASGHFRVEATDFVVEEIMQHALADAGEHLWLWIEKTGLTTYQAIERLGRECGVSPRQIGFAGMKDRHATTYQWVSMPWPIKSGLPVFSNSQELCVHSARRHTRKLKRGAHAANRFTIRLRDLGAEGVQAVAGQVDRIAREGVPNYFGEQRFGRGGTNVEMARELFAGARLARNKRSIALSAARSFLFNEVLSARVADGCWRNAVGGDVFMLAGSNSVFAADDTDECQSTLAERLAAGDISPTGPMPGRLGPRSVVPGGRAAAYEATVSAAYPDLLDGLAAARVDAERRALVLPVADLSITPEGSDCTVAFCLDSGAFATSVLRELGDFRDAMRQGVSP